jgi:hypothetical protein
MEKALNSRRIELKGSDKASFTIPIIYRRTFAWSDPEILFQPVNHRGFVVYRGDLESEEYRRDMYSDITLRIEKLPSYVNNRVEKNDENAKVELKEAILAASLKNRYVHIHIPKPEDKKLYECLKTDMEHLMDELGFEYSTDHKGILCTFKFPKHDMKYYALESRGCVIRAIETMKHFQEQLNAETPGNASKMLSLADELLYHITRFELLMDRYYSDALNMIWDLPSVTTPGFFLWISSCERIMDEFLFIAHETRNALSSLKTDDLKLISMDKNIFGYVWSRAVEKCLLFCEKALSTIELELDQRCSEYLSSFDLIYEHERHRLKAKTDQSKFIGILKEDITMKDPERSQRLMTVSYHLNNIFQAGERIIIYSTSIAKTTLHIGTFDDLYLEC